MALSQNMEDNRVREDVAAALEEVSSGGRLRRWWLQNTLDRRVNDLLREDLSTFAQDLSEQEIIRERMRSEDPEYSELDRLQDSVDHYAERCSRFDSAVQSAQEAGVAIGDDVLIERENLDRLPEVTSLLHRRSELVMRQKMAVAKPPLPEHSVFVDEAASLVDIERDRAALEKSLREQGRQQALEEGYPYESRHVPIPPQKDAELQQGRLLKSMADLEGRLTRSWNKIQDMVEKSEGSISVDEVDARRVRLAHFYVSNRDGILSGLQAAQYVGVMNQELLDGYARLDSMPVLDDLEDAVPFARGEDHLGLERVALQYLESSDWVSEEEVLGTTGVELPEHEAHESRYEPELRGGRATYPPQRRLANQPIGPARDWGAEVQRSQSVESEGQLDLDQLLTPKERSNKHLREYAESIPGAVYEATVEGFYPIEVVDSYLETRATLLMDMRRVDRAHGLEPETISSYKALDLEVDTDYIKHLLRTEKTGHSSTPQEVEAVVASGDAHMRLMRNVLSHEHDGKQLDFRQMAAGPEPLIPPEPAAEPAKGPVRLRHDPSAPAPAGGVKLRGVELSDQADHSSESAFER